MKYVQAIAAVCALAVGSFIAGQVAADGPNPDLVVEQPTYDIGIVSAVVEVDKDRPVVEVPKDKADRLVVVSATWCVPCRALAPTLEALKLQGYKVEYFDVDEDLEKLAEKYSNIKKVKGSDKVNHWFSVPTIFYIRDNMIIKKETGNKTAVHIRKTLWKPSDDEPSQVEKVRRRFPWNR